MEIAKQTPSEDRTEEETKEYKNTLSQRNSLVKWFIKQPKITVDIFKDEISLNQKNRIIERIRNVFNNKNG